MRRWSVGCEGLLAVVVTAVLLAGCSGSSAEESTAGRVTETTGEAAERPTDDSTEQPSEDTAEQLHPEVLDATFAPGSGGAFDIRVTLSSPYDTPDRYADAWRVSTADGEVLGVRELAHDHANEQPFTRELRGVSIPDDVRTVLVAGRDQVNGWGEAVEFTVPGRP